MEELIVYADIIGTVAGILVLSSFIPQLMKAYKTKKMFDVSAHLMILISSGMFLWVIYGFIRSSHNWNECYGFCIKHCFVDNEA